MIVGSVSEVKKRVLDTDAAGMIRSKYRLNTGTRWLSPKTEMEERTAWGGRGVSVVRISSTSQEWAFA